MRRSDREIRDMDASEKLAESIAEESRGDEAKYLSLIEADAGPDSAYATGDYSRRDNYTYTYVPENLADWLFDTGRREGDTTAVQNGENGWFAVYYLSLNTHDYTTADLRVVEVADYYKDADKAYKAAQKLLETFESGDRTESSFAALADENGAEDGGFKQNTALGELDDAAEAWAFDAARQPGDAAAVKGENSASSYLVYYVGPGMPEEKSAGRDEEYVVQMKGITKVYPNGVAANQGVDFNLRKGEIHALMNAPSVHGESGLDGPALPEPARPESELGACELMECTVKFAHRHSRTGTIARHGRRPGTRTVMN